MFLPCIRGGHQGHSLLLVVGPILEGERNLLVVVGAQSIGERNLEVLVVCFY